MRARPFLPIRIQAFRVVLGALLVSGASVAAPVPGRPTAEQRATRFVGMLHEGKFAEAAQAFDETMKRAMPPNKLEGVWKGVTSQAGGFKRVASVRGQKQGANEIVLATCEFEKTRLDVKVVFDKEQRIAGLWVLPVQAGAQDEAKKGKEQKATTAPVAKGQEKGAQPKAEAAEDERAKATVGKALPAQPSVPASPAAETAGPDSSKSLEQLWDDFLFYTSVGQFKLAKEYGQAVLAREPNGVVLLRLSEKNRTTFEILELLHERGHVGDLADKILALISEGRYAERTDPKRIDREVERLGQGPRAEAGAIESLRDSGEYAVPALVAALQDPAKEGFRESALRALRAIGKDAIQPLLAAIQMKDPSAQEQVIETLGRIGYPQALPYLKLIAEQGKANPAIVTAARRAIARIDPEGTSMGQSAADLFYAQATEYYYDRSSLQPPADRPEANIWLYGDKGLVYVPVPRTAFNEVMAMQACEHALRADAGYAAAVSLWLAAYLQLEAQSGGSKLALWDDQHPRAEYYCVASGPEYLQAVLARALRDRNAAVAMGAIRALTANAGESSLLYRLEGTQPLVEALRYPDQQVRLWAAIALAAAQPQSAFEGSDRVVPILAKALGQHGGRYGIVVDPNRDRANALRATVRAMGFDEVVVVTGFRAALQEAARLPSADLLVVSSDLADPDVTEAMRLKEADFRLSTTPTLIVAQEGAMIAARALARTSPFTSVVTERAGPGELKAAYESILRDTGKRTVSAQEADAWALRAADLLLELARSGGSVLSCQPAEPALIEALKDPRDAIRAKAAAVLAYCNSVEAQRAIAALALSREAAEAVRLAAFQSLAQSAKRHGNLLDEAQVDAIYTVATAPEESAMRLAAAKAYGSLNLPSEKVRDLILRQARW